MRQFAEVGSKSLPLVIASGLALGAVMALHTRSTLVTFGATSIIPTVQALAFIVEIGPLVTALLVAGRVGSGIGAVLANMRTTEQIDSIESLSIDSFKFLVVPRVIACTLSLPLLTLFMDFSGLLGGFLSEFAVSGLSPQLYIFRAFSAFEWSNFWPSTLKTCVFGFTIPSREPVELSELLTRGTDLLNHAQGMLQDVGGRLGGTLDTVTSTVSNVNDLVVGLKQGRGAAGMLLRDEALAKQVRHTVVGASSSVDDILAGLKAGRGPAGLLLQDEAVAAQIREA
ncbi:MAG TPA: ABC transporter permease, partial [Bryobacteraceae bacterium]|nr:ABC transporter permease [Bryobacteraceae bacterium]